MASLTTFSTINELLNVYRKKMNRPCAEYHYNNNANEEDGDASRGSCGFRCASVRSWP